MSKMFSKFRPMKLFVGLWVSAALCGSHFASAQGVPRFNGPAGAQPGPTAGPGAAYASNEPNRDFDQAIDRHFNEKNLPGLVVLYGRDGMLTYKRSKGFADVGSNLPMNETSISRLNSVSKLLGTVVLLRLEEQNKIDLKKKARDILPDLPGHHTYRVVDLLACRSGVRHYGGSVSPQSPKNWTESDYDFARDAIPNFWLDPLAAPVSAYHYSSFGYSISDACAEQVTGKAFRELLQTHVSIPAGASTLKVEDRETANPKRVKYYTQNGSSNVEVTPPKKEWTPSGGGMESSALDLLKVGIALGDGKLISKQNVKRMMTRVDPLESYGLGCSHATENGYEVMAKSGAEEGSNAYIWLVPERRMVMVILANRDSADVSGLGRELRQIALGVNAVNGEKPDLVAGEFSRTAPVAYKNGHVEFPVKFTVTNSGKSGVNAQFVNAIKVDGVVRWSGFTDPMPKGGKESFTAVIKVPDSGKTLAGRTLNVELSVDAPLAAGDSSVSAKGRIDEASEQNNSALLAVAVPGGLDIASPKPQPQGSQTVDPAAPAVKAGGKSGAAPTRSSLMPPARRKGA
jgi:serine beta-lactamase-like protein LACTB, mitochondrial